MHEDVIIFKVADFLASRARKTTAYARHPAPPKRVNLPSLQVFLVFTKRTGNANGTILKHRVEEPNDAYITSDAAEKPPCSVSAVTPSSRESTFSLSPWQGPRPAAKMKEYFSSLHLPFALNLSPSFRWWKASFVTGHFEVNPRNALSFVSSQRMLAVLLQTCCAKKAEKMCGTPRGYSKPLKSNGLYISLSLTKDKTVKIREPG